jgi:hypothetical protein
MWEEPTAVATANAIADVRDILGDLPNVRQDSILIGLINHPIRVLNCSTAAVLNRAKKLCEV